MWPGFTRRSKGMTIWVILTYIHGIDNHYCLLWLLSIDRWVKVDLEGTLWALKLKRNTLLPSWKARGCGEVIMPLLCYTSHGKLDSRYHRYLCLILANHFVDGWMVWSGMGDLYVVFTWKDTGDTTGHCICLKRRRRYLFWCSYGCVSLVAKGR